MAGVGIVNWILSLPGGIVAWCGGWAAPWIGRGWLPFGLGRWRPALLVVLVTCGPDPET